VVGKAKIMRYEDIFEAEQKRETMKKSAAAGGATRQKKRKVEVSASVTAKRSQRNELKEARNEIEGAGLEAYCSVFQI
jgi:hypothetical protein